MSDQAIYIQGNYNAYSTQTRGQKQPAAVIGDSLNLLSQTWEVPIFAAGRTRANDRKSLSNAWQHRYVQVQDAPCGPAGCGPNLFYGLNAALLGGVDNTAGSSYNGGLENYPRFHEKWSSRTFVYRGSFVSLGTPVHADGSWTYGNPIYEAPARDWDYNQDFNRVENLPPLTPKVTYLEQKMYTRMYD